MHSQAEMAKEMSECECVQQLFKIVYSEIMIIELKLWFIPVRAFNT